MTCLWRHPMRQRSCTSVVNVSAFQECRRFDYGVLRVQTAGRSWSEFSRCSTGSLRRTRPVDTVRPPDTVSSWLTCRPGSSAVGAITARSTSVTRTWWAVVLTPSTCRSTTPAYRVSTSSAICGTDRFSRHDTNHYVLSSETTTAWDETTVLSFLAQKNFPSKNGEIIFPDFLILATTLLQTIFECYFRERRRERELKWLSFRARELELGTTKMILRTINE